MNDEQVFRKVETIANGKVRCECGNDDWREFLYVAPDSNPGCLAGCKTCGSIYEYTGSKWRFRIAGPKQKLHVDGMPPRM